MKGKVCGSLRESIYASATGTALPLKAVAADLDWSPSELSMRITQYGDNARPFPFDDEHLLKLLRTTGDHSALYTLADLLGYEVRPKESRTAEMLVAVPERGARAAAEDPARARSRREAGEGGRAMTYIIRVHRDTGQVAEHTGQLRVTEGGALLIVETEGAYPRVIAGYAPTAWTRVVTEAV